MATTPKPKPKMAANRPAQPELQTEVANRLTDPFETAFQGIIRTNDPLLLQRGEHGNPWALYRDLKRDPKIFSCNQRRKMALISRPFSVNPIEDAPYARRDAAVVEKMLRKLMFDNLCSGLMDANIVGFQPAEIVWGLDGKFIAPVRIPRRAQRRFIYVQTDANMPPELRLLTASNMLTGESLPERKFIVHRVNPEDDNPYGTGMGLQLFWAKFFKDKNLLSWSRTNERFGSPTPWGKYPNGAGKPEKATLFDALKAMNNDGVIMTPEGMSIELLESKLTGTITSQKELCQYMDSWIAEVILSQEPGQSTGATASAANEREDVRLDIVQADADLLSDTLNSTLIAWICELNGLAPCTVSRDIKKPEDRLANSQTDANIAALGFKPTLEYIRERYGDGWEEATPPAPPPAPALAAPAATVAPAVAQTPTQGLPPPAPRPNEPAASFAEPSPAAAPTDALAVTLARAGDAVLTTWMQTIAQMVSQADSREALSDALVKAYGDLPSEKLQEIMALAFAAAELSGMDAVADEAKQDA